MLWGWNKMMSWDNAPRFCSILNCEMKIYPAISINKKCHSHQKLLASKCEWRLPKLGAYERNEFKEPRSLHLPTQRTRNSLTWYLTFDVQITCSLVAQLVKNLPAMWEDLGSIPGLGRSPGEGKGYLLILGWRIPSTMQSMGSQIVGQTEGLSLSLQTCSLTPAPASLEQFSQTYWDPVSWARCPNIPTK